MRGGGVFGGLGLLEATATGVRSGPTLSCVTQGELDEALSKCPPNTTLRGLGAPHGSRAFAPMSGRLAAISPCEIAGLPVCPAPKCLDQYTAGLIAQCIAGSQTNPDFDCTSLYTYALSQLPFCGGSALLPPLPGCLTPELIAARDYCAKYPNSDGPNKSGNAGCWAARHDPAYWAKLLATPVCYTQSYVPPAPNPPHTQDPPVRVEAPPVFAPPTQESEASMMGTWGILALLAAAGGGYYMYRRYKR